MPGHNDLHYSFQPLVGDASFDVVSFTLEEGLSTPFKLNLELISEQDDVDFAQLLDQPVLFTVWSQQRPVRYVHGLISRFSQGDSGFRRTRYHALVEPQLARARLRSNWRIFQQKTAVQILELMFKAQRLTRISMITCFEHQVREFCVQAGETDLDFIARLAAEEGFIYRFAHTAEGHELIITDRLLALGLIDSPGCDIDDPRSAQSLDTPDIAVRYQPNSGGDRPAPALRRLRYSEQVRTARQVQRDYTFRNPAYRQEHTAIDNDLPYPSMDYERFDYPGRYKRDQVARPFTQTRLAGLRHDARLAHVQGDDIRLQPGLSFDLVEHPREDLNVHWRIMSVRHEGTQFTSLQEEAADAERGTHYEQHAVLIPGRLEWKPEPLPKPHIDGPHMATVVGPPGEQIHCDEWGRVKVSFPWDRDSQDNEFSSCWVRVSQGWAGGSWGSMAIPRIGQEVIVQYVNADPDQPLITGRTYCGNQLPPYELPRHKTRMTLKSQTHKGEGFNELRFEDELGQEEVFIHAQRDRNNVVRHDETTQVGNDRSERVEHDEQIEIGNDRTENVVNDEAVTVGRDRHHRVVRNRSDHTGGHHDSCVEESSTSDVQKDRFIKTGGHCHSQTAGNARHEVAGSYQLNVENQIDQTATRIAVEAGQRLELIGPAGRIVLDDKGVTIEGLEINLKGTLNLQTNAATHSGWFGKNISSSGPLEEFFVLCDAHTGAPLKNHAYQIKRASGQILRATTDALGRTQTVDSSFTEPLELTPLMEDSERIKIQASYWDAEGTGFELDFHK